MSSDDEGVCRVRFARSQGDSSAGPSPVVERETFRGVVGLHYLQRPADPATFAASLRGQRARFVRERGGRVEFDLPPERVLFEETVIVGECSVAVRNNLAPR